MSRPLWTYLLESLVCGIPCYLTEQWFFWQVGGIREKIATYFVQGYYGAGRRWESRTTDDELRD